MSVDVAANLRVVLGQARAAAQKAGRANVPRLVAVSKRKPIELLRQAYDAGQRVFGENYVQELESKAPHLPADIEWHFIGHLQRNKCNKLLKCMPSPETRLVVETVDSTRLADALNKSASTVEHGVVDVFVQVNTSADVESTKNGVLPEDAVEVAAHIHHDCERLRLRGLMTIGAPGPDAEFSRQFFERLCECRASVARALELPEDALELSMGMSADVEVAVDAGSTNVRVGSAIFGARDPK